MPYVTGVSTALDKAYISKPSVFNRSATGAYPVRRGESITITGYNLKNGSTAPTVKLNNTENLITVTASSAASITATVGSGTSVVSGDLDVIVSDITSLNNKTDKSLEYNQEPNGVNNDILTNARKLKVWSFNTVVSDSTVRYSTMRVGKDSAQTIGFVYDSGAQALRMNQGGNDYLIDWSFTQWYDTSVAVDNAGRMYGSGMNGDSGGTGNQSWVSGGYANYGFYAWNTKTYPGQIYASHDSSYYAPGNGRYLNHQAYNSGRKKVALENSAADSSGNKYNANRIVNPKVFVSSGTTTSSTGYIYTVYYDAIYDRVVFRYGTVSGTIDSNNSLTFTDGIGNHNNKNNGSATGYQTIASSGSSGEYSAVGVIPSTAASGAGTAVVAWYDASNTRLLFSYNTAPTSTANAANWGTNTKVIDSDFAGWYVDMAVDPEGGIHIAYYGASAGDLKYAYMSSYTATPQVMTVDSYLSVGTNISIEVPTAKETVYAADGTSTVSRYVPRISYFMSAFTKTTFSIRMAYPYKLNASNNFTDGVVNDMFTGNWEVMSVPTNQIPLDYTIGVGIKKNDSNVNSALLGYGTKTGLQTAALQ